MPCPFCCLPLSPALPCPLMPSFSPALQCPPASASLLPCPALPCPPTRHPSHLSYCCTNSARPTRHT
eukprot:364424-Chlamydomonas_euryale.AAC.8